MFGLLCWPYTRGFFNWGFLVQYQNEKKDNEPTRDSLRWRISWNRISHWLIGIFHFGTEQELKKIIIEKLTSLISSLIIIIVIFDNYLMLQLLLYRVHTGHLFIWYQFRPLKRFITKVCIFHCNCMYLCNSLSIITMVVVLPPLVNHTRRWQTPQLCQRSKSAIVELFWGCVICQPWNTFKYSFSQ